MLVYLHSEEHEKTETFCRSALCTAETRRFLEEVSGPSPWGEGSGEDEAAGGSGSDIGNRRRTSLTCWSGEVTHHDGFVAARLLSACRFPFIALLLHDNRNLVRILYMDDTGNLDGPALRQNLAAVSMLLVAG